MIPAVLVGVACFAGMGFGVTSLIRSAEGASAVVNLIVLPMAFLSGSFGPTRKYPEVLRWLADLLPLTYLIRLLKDVYLRGGSFFGHPKEIAILLAWGLAGVAHRVAPLRLGATRAVSELPFGAAEIVAAVGRRQAGARRRVRQRAADGGARRGRRCGDRARHEHGPAGGGRRGGPPRPASR